MYLCLSWTFFFSSVSSKCILLIFDMTHTNTHVFLSPPLFLHLEDLSPLGVAHERKKICFNSEKKKSDLKLFHLFSPFFLRTKKNSLSRIVFYSDSHLKHNFKKPGIFVCLFHAFLKHFPGNIFPAGFSHEKKLGYFFFLFFPWELFSTHMKQF